MGPLRVRRRNYIEHDPLIPFPILVPRDDKCLGNEHVESALLLPRSIRTRRTSSSSSFSVCRRLPLPCTSTPAWPHLIKYSCPVFSSSYISPEPLVLSLLCWASQKTIDSLLRPRDVPWLRSSCRLNWAEGRRKEEESYINNIHSIRLWKFQLI